jgi:phosphoribosylaminoimidazole (AIR) synthetase
MGVGMTLIVSEGKVDAIQRFIKSYGHKSWVIGEVVKGKGIARMID